ncbi:hypothetical protein GQ44DRAFT_830588 [Phaeosphaeriaceae sp. PMI808]|nr:hypothetical protein GQ44DRAFT_830588 [Phaeosphaeriaceae sp. PMI808]
MKTTFILAAFLATAFAVQTVQPRDEEPEVSEAELGQVINNAACLSRGQTCTWNFGKCCTGLRCKRVNSFVYICN